MTSVFDQRADWVPDCPVRDRQPLQRGMIADAVGVSRARPADRRDRDRSRPGAIRRRAAAALRRRVGVGRRVPGRGDRRPGCLDASDAAHRRRRFPGTRDVAHAGERVARHLRQIRELLARRQQPEHRHHRERRHAGDASRDRGAARQLVPPEDRNPLIGPSRLLTGGGVNSGH